MERIKSAENSLISLVMNIFFLNLFGFYGCWVDLSEEIFYSETIA